jgi:hypothetical protein
MPYLTEEEEEKLKNVEKGVKNRWRWGWLDEKDKNGVELRAWVQKIDSSGVAFCTVCLKSVKYGTSGKTKLMKLSFLYLGLSLLPCVAVT